MLDRWNTRGWDDLFDGMNQLRSVMDRMLEPGWTGSAADPTMSFFAGGWPQINLADEGTRLVLTALVPGMARDDIQLTLANDVLTLKGERKLRAPEGYVSHRREREAQRFTRSVTLPCHIDPERVSASMTDGVLTVSLEKVERAKPRQISVESAV